MSQGRIATNWYVSFPLLLAASLIAGIIWLLIHPHGMVILAGLVCVQLLGVLGPWLNLVGCRGRIEAVSDRAMEGDTVSVLMVVENRSWFPSWGTSVEAGGAFASALPYIGAKGVLREQLRFQAVRRGRYPTGCRLKNAFPFGLMGRQRELDCRRCFIVWPKTFAVPGLPDSDSGSRQDGWRLSHRVGTGGDFLAVRPYRRGDALRHIHWSQTARHDQLVVCERQAPTRPVVMLFLDVDPDHHYGEGPDHSLEWAIRIAASFVVGWGDLGIPIGLHLGAEVFPPASGGRQRRKLLDALALFGACSQQQSLAQALDKGEGNEDCVQIVIAPAPALALLSARQGCLPKRHFVALRGPAFVRVKEIDTPMPIRPWIEVTDPARVAEQLALPGNHHE